MPESLLRAVVFDLDGLLFNTEELYQFVGSELMRRRGKTYDEALIHRVMGRPQPVALQMMIRWTLDHLNRTAAPGARVRTRRPSFAR